MAIDRINEKRDENEEMLDEKLVDAISKNSLIEARNRKTRGIKR